MSVKNDQELAAKLTNFDGDRYDVVVLASMWAKELKKKDPYKNMPMAAVIKDALDDILSKRVTKNEVLHVSKENLEAELKAQEAARLEAERKAKEPMKL
jgi:Arc/MetJ-type ribon-helix-helix transcriptional regulator